jgi:cytoskeletal protein RodZ
VSIERAAEETRIRPDFLMRMESDDFDFLAPAYVRGFLRSYARYLHADPEPLMAEFDARFGAGRVDTAQIAALEKQSRNRYAAAGPKISSWKLAAAVAGGLLVVLAIIGLLQSPDEGTPPVASSSPSPEASASPSAEANPSVSPSSEPSSPGRITFADGIDLVIFARKGDCWISVEEDGVDATNGGFVVSQGDKIKFRADDSLSMRLGFPKGVELIVNGQNVGSPPGGVDPIDLELPDDIDALL